MRFDTIRECEDQTDIPTDGHWPMAGTALIRIASRGKKYYKWSPWALSSFTFTTHNPTTTKLSRYKCKCSCTTDHIKVFSFYPNLTLSDLE